MPEQKPKKKLGESLRLDELPEAAFITDADHIVRSANKAALELLGYSAEEVVGWPLDKVFPKRPRGVSMLFSGGGEAKFEIPMRTKAGRSVLASFVASTLVRGGKVEGVIYLGRDIRLSRLVESEIKKARDYFRAIVENSPTGICVTDADRRIVMSNKVAADITGYEVDELVGTKASVFYADSKSVAIDVDALRKGQKIGREVEFRRKDRSIVPVLVYYSLVEDPRGEREMIIESYSDLSDRKRLDRLKNEFVFVAAHELRSPVTAIRLLLNMIFEDKRVTLDPLLRGYLMKVQEADQRLLQLVDDLLEVSRSESGRLKIHVSPQNLAEHVLAVYSEFKPNALTKDVNLRYVPIPHMPQVLADPSKLKEILANLVANAIKYNVAGGTVTIEHELRGGMLITHVADTGIGISEEDQARTFEKFWRSEDRAVRAQSGTGLGLFICKELVERMGGTIDVWSKIGRGTTFTFTLPLVATKGRLGRAGPAAGRSARPKGAK